MTSKKHRNVKHRKKHRNVKQVYKDKIIYIKKNVFFVKKKA